MLYFNENDMFAQHAKKSMFHQDRQRIMDILSSADYIVSHKMDIDFMQKTIDIHVILKESWNVMQKLLGQDGKNLFTNLIYKNNKISALKLTIEFREGV
jgi:hypothetical protein